MKCEKCPCAYYPQSFDGDYDFQCMAGMEDDMNNAEDGCRLRRKTVEKIAKESQDAHTNYIIDFSNWLEETGYFTEKNGG